MPSEDPQRKKRKVVTSDWKTISASKLFARHPLNVRPLGNAFLIRENNGLSKDDQMGHFSRFPEELFMEILGYVDEKYALLALSHTSRVLYAYLYDEDLWKLYYTREVQKLERMGQTPPLLTWNGSWRLSVLGLKPENLADLQLPDNLLCSDVLYRPFQCSQVDYEMLFHKLIDVEEKYHTESLENLDHLDAQKTPVGGITRLLEKNFTQEEFDSYWNTRPFILVNSESDRWPKWDLEALLQRFADVKFRQEAVQWPLSLYAEYLAKNNDESPLYLFDCSSKAMNTLRKEYTAPEIFQQDLFTVFGSCRPDHAWVIIGSKRSGSTFHKDPNYTSAWNVAISGRKLWVMFPPDVTPPGVSTDDDESEVTSPVGIAEWVISGFYNDATRLEGVQIGITFPGECMYVPSGWWHTVINLDDSVAITQNFVPEVKLGNALNFLKNKRAQLSGFRPLQVRLKLQEVMDINKVLDEDMQKITAYAKRFDELNLQEFLQTEDCGEILESQLPPMPVFELFKKLLVLNGKEEVLSQGLNDLERIEKHELAKTIGKSEAWTKLTLETLFSFGFGDVE